MSVFIAGGWTRWSLKVPSNPKHFMIPWWRWWKPWPEEAFSGGNRAQTLWLPLQCLSSAAHLVALLKSWVKAALGPSRGLHCLSKARWALLLFSFGYPGVHFAEPQTSAFELIICFSFVSAQRNQPSGAQFPSILWL